MWSGSGWPTMMKLPSEVLDCLAGKTLVTAESCTGGLIGALLTAVPGSSAVYKGGVISYCNEIKHRLLGVPEDLLAQYGAVSAPVAQAMALGDIADLDALRQVVRNSENVNTWLPNHTPAWEEAYRKLLTFLK